MGIHCLVLSILASVVSLDYFFFFLLPFFPENESAIAYTCIDCDNALQNGGAIAASSGCNMACNGAPSEICGGSNRLSLYEHNTTADSGGGTGSTNPQVWNFKGCYTDSVTARTLSQRLEGGSTIEGCQSACKAMGYVYSGVEYASECCKSPSHLLPLSFHPFTSGIKLTCL